MSSLKKVCCAGVFLSLLPFCASQMGWAGSHILRGEMSLIYDFEDRNYRDRDNMEDRTHTFNLQPELHYTCSPDSLDSYDVKLSPTLKYDIEDSEFDADFYNLWMSFFNQASRKLSVYGSNSYVKSDEQDSIDVENNKEEGVASLSRASVDLSEDRGRARHWTNNLQMGMIYNYVEDSNIGFNAGYDILRNEDSSEQYSDYDRYTVTVSNRHRIDGDWATNLFATYVRGEYDDDEAEAEAAGSGADEAEAMETMAVTRPSRDVREYRFGVSVDNYSFQKNVFSLGYDFIGAKYLDELQDDKETHQARISWLKNFNQNFSSTLGAGPSYQKTGDDGEWGFNGVFALNYTMERSSVKFQVEKNYDVKNFSGTNERGTSDSWITTLRADYWLNENVSVDTALSYTQETLEEPARDESDGVDGSRSVVAIENYDKALYRAVFGLSYNFTENYFTNFAYTYSKRDSDRSDDEYNDHRFLFTLSWAQDLMKW